MVEATPDPDDPPADRGAGAAPACNAPGCSNPGGAFTAERGGRIYEFCSEACRAKFEST